MSMNGVEPRRLWSCPYCGVRHGPSEAVQVGRLRVDPQARAAFVNGRPVHLSPQEYRVLSALVRRPGVLVTQDGLWNAMQCRDESMYGKSLGIVMCNLRKAVGDAVRISVVWNEGYRLDPPDDELPGGLQGLMQ